MNIVALAEICYCCYRFALERGGNDNVDVGTSSHADLVFAVIHEIKFKVGTSFVTVRSENLFRHSFTILYFDNYIVSHYANFVKEKIKLPAR